MADNQAIDLMEQRIISLEQLVFGQSEKDADYPKNVKVKTQIIDSLLEIQGKIGTALKGKKKAALIYEKLPELNKYLDNSYIEELTLSSEAKEEIVVAESDLLESQASLLKQLSENQEHMNSEHIQAVPKYTEKLQALSQVQIDQQDQLATISEETRRLLEAYNNVVNLLSKQFIMWDEHISQLEMKANSKK